MAKKSGLGRGLDALLGDNSDNGGNVEISLSDISPNPNQPRKHFDEDALRELADNISRYGLLQPVVVHTKADGSYEIVAGERRWRACRMAGLTTIPVIIKDLTDSEIAEIALIENLQREDLSPVEEARGYESLINQFDMTQEQVAQKVGKSRSAVANSLRLLELGEFLPLLENGTISAGHGRALLAIKDKAVRMEALELIKSGATVRDIEKFAKARNESAEAKPTTKKTTKRPSYYDEVELSLKSELGRRVKVSASGKRGTLNIDFYNEEDLANLIEFLFSRR